MTDLRAIFHDIVKGTSDVPYLVSAWQHLIGHEYGAEEFAAAYVDFVRRWDWQWVKINPRAIYYSEAWGSRYDRDDYAGFVIPKKLKAGIETPADVAGIARLDPTKDEYFAEALAAAALIRAQLTDRAVLQTVFSPLSVLLQIADLPLYPGDDYATPTLTVEDVVLGQSDVAKRALDNIAATLADYAAALVTPTADGGAGLDGVFYAVTGTVSEDYFDDAQYREFSEPYDRIVIDAIRKANPDAVVLLHTCRADSHPDWFDRLGVDLIHWDQYLPGNPKADADLKATVVAGANAPLFASADNVEQIRKEIKGSIALRAGKPFLVAPSCTVPTPAADEALQALSDARVAA
ncbi:uroporphyrinogen decarboxylase [Bifidobacterium ramosum]|uniref:Uroporphyrinogen decarboxylase n=1 Tax=Bifidobacterium ramosum TaxID=1798158 RepID=A0A6L4X056_9BIFI|nr:uroporphyrinogen decarboxylase family protein [Bifidobacterium ramosum]KAB8287767.1 uroporphyrinogen decarboxylase [Bifidobacterium ramosum]NEG71285.1 uroporphyrinogen decarboxylase [Bifidobacterium ramosum]